MHSLSSIPALPEAAQTPVGAEAFIGLTARPKTLSPWLFYDEEGSRLFEAITELPEYYLTRTERAIFARTPRRFWLRQRRFGRPSAGDDRAGCGHCGQDRPIAKSSSSRQGAVDYLAIDVSESALAEARQRIETEIPGVTVSSCVADYTGAMEEIPAEGKRRMVLYIGSSIGNFEPADAVHVLREVRRRLDQGDNLLLGADHVKERSVLVRAYDDEAEVTAAFNKNVLTRINRELGGNFNPRLFRHRARWNHEHARIEMHLESLIAQQVRIEALELDVRFARGETIHTENSYKFTTKAVVSMLEQAGFTLTQCWSDEREWFGVYLATAM